MEKTHDLTCKYVLGCNSPMCYVTEIVQVNAFHPVSMTLTRQAISVQGQQQTCFAEWRQAASLWLSAKLVLYRTR